MYSFRYIFTKHSEKVALPVTSHRALQVFSPILEELKEKPGSHKANRVSESNELSEISLRPP
jgi:hypothetical protein